VPGPFTFVTLAQAEADLVGRLYDPQSQFGSGAFYWTAAELSTYLQEALRTWNALTSLWRTNFNLTLSTGVTWYDITTAAGSPRPLTVTDNLITSQIEYHILEPQTTTYPLSWTGSAQFSINDILGAIQRRRDETLSVTGCEITLATVTASTSTATTTLSDSVIDIRRVVWLPSAGGAQYLSPEDVFETQFFNFEAAGSGVPEVWWASTQPPLSFVVDYVPNAAGNYEILTVNAGPALSASAPTVLGIPDDWSFVVKWGALADLLSREGDAKDDVRADYCEKRYREGLSLLIGAPAILAAWLGITPIFVDPVRGGDDFNVNWEGATAGSPIDFYVAGLNLIASNPAPNSNAYLLTLSVVQNAPFTDGSGYLQVSREDYDVIIDYAQHLAAFKLGGKEFVQTLPLYQRFLKQAAIYNSKIAQLGTYKMTIYETSQQEAERNPVSDPKVID
jgi:hypothetical protein